MFTGIIETLGQVQAIEQEGSNTHFKIQSEITQELKVDQSVAHNGACLTVTQLEEDGYWVTAIEETLQKTNLGNWKVQDKINLERSMLLNGRLDGHIVQGHVDQIATCILREEKEGSWLFTFEYDAQKGNMTVEKGSICVNGVSLTVVEAYRTGFSVAIIPYTYHHTNFQTLQKGDIVNLEFDIIGKYVQKMLSHLK